MYVFVWALSVVAMTYNYTPCQQDHEPPPLPPPPSTGKGGERWPGLSHPIDEVKYSMDWLKKSDLGMKKVRQPLGHLHLRVVSQERPKNESVYLVWVVFVLLGGGVRGQ